VLIIPFAHDPSQQRLPRKAAKSLRAAGQIRLGASKLVQIGFEIVLNPNADGLRFHFILLARHGIERQRRRRQWPARPKIERVSGDGSFRL
jgi:hypothetical protein